MAILLFAESEFHLAVSTELENLFQHAVLQKKSSLDPIIFRRILVLIRKFYLGNKHR